MRYKPQRTKLNDEHRAKLIAGFALLVLADFMKIRRVRVTFDSNLGGFASALSDHALSYEALGGLATFICSFDCWTRIDGQSRES